MIARSTKPNRCKHCRERMPPELARHVLHDDCIPAFVKAQAAKKERARLKKERDARKVEKAIDRRRKAEQETIPQLIKKADKEFASFIRLRDQLAGELCISSGRPLDWSGNKTDAGHYRSKGAASHLRYHEDNCHAQTKEQNRFKAGNAVDYRIHLIARIGIARVDALECNNEVTKWTRDTLRQIAVTYREKFRELKKERA